MNPIFLATRTAAGLIRTGCFPSAYALLDFLASSFRLAAHCLQHIAYASFWHRQMEQAAQEFFIRWQGKYWKTGK